MSADKTILPPHGVRSNMSPDTRLRVALAVARDYNPDSSNKEHQKLLLNTIRAFVWDRQRDGATPQDILDTLMNETVPPDEDEWSVY